MKPVNSIVKQYLLHNSKPVGFIIMFGVLGSIVSFLVTIIIGSFFALRFHQHGSKSRLLDMLGINLTSLHSFFSFFLLLVLLKGLFTLIYKLLLEIYGEQFSRQTREMLFAAQIMHPPEVFLRKKHGNYLLRYSGDLKAARNYLTSGVLGAIRQILFLTIGIILLACIHAKLTLCLIGLFCVAMLLSAWIISFQKKRIKRSRDLRSNLLAFVSAKFNRYLKINEAGLQDKTIEGFKVKSGQLYEASCRVVKYESMIRAVIPVMQYLMLALLLYFSANLTPAISYSDTLIFVLIVLLLFSDMRRMMKLKSVLNKGAVSLEKMEELIMARQKKEPKLIPSAGMAKTGSI